MANPAKIAILISGRGSNMAAIAKACERREIDADVVTVIADRHDAPGLALAQTMNIPTASFSRKDYDSKSQHEAAMAAHLDKFTPDLICLAGFMRILSGHFVANYRGKILNIHPSLLPRYKGLDTHARALANGDAQHGCTVHFVTEGLDEGPIILQKSVSIEIGETEQSLAQKVLQIEHKLYVDAVNIVLNKH